MPTQWEAHDSPIRVLIGDGGYSFAADGIDITMALRYDAEHISIMRIQEGGYHAFEPHEVGTQVKPTLTLSTDFARALLDALMRHYQGASDMHTVRSDLIHERGRVDKLTDALIESNAIQVRMRDYVATRTVIGD